MTARLGHLALALVDRLAALPQVEGVLLGGSRAGGDVDAASDYDFYVYCADGIPVETRRLALADLFRVVEWDNRYWETEDDGVFADAPDGTAGAPVDIVYRPLAWALAQLEDRLVRHRADTGYTTCVWHNIRHGVPLFDRQGLVAELQRRAAAPYPEELRRAIVDKNRPLLRTALPNYRHQLEQALSRADAVSCNHRAAAFLASYFDIVCAANRLPHPGEKRLLETLRTRAAQLPEGMADDVRAFLCAAHAPAPDPRAVLGSLDRLADGLDALLARLALL